MYRSLQLASLGLITVLGLITSPVYAEVAAAHEATLSVAVLGADEDADDSQSTPELMLLLAPAGTCDDPAAADSAPCQLPADRTAAIPLSHCQVASPPSICPLPLRC
jgi:hypothetical protein